MSVKDACGIILLTMSETLKQSSPESDSYIPSSIEGLSRVGEYLVADYMLRTWERSCQKYPFDDVRPVAEILDKLASGDRDQALTILEENGAEDAFILTSVALFHPDGVDLVKDALTDVYGEPSPANLQYLKKVENYHQTQIEKKFSQDRRNKLRLGKITIDYDDSTSLEEKVAALDEAEQKALKLSWMYYSFSSRGQNNTDRGKSEELSYKEKWLSYKGLFDSVVSVPETKGDHHSRLSAALASAVLNHNIPTEQIERVSGILTSNTLPFFARQMTVFQLIHPLETLDLEYGLGYSEKTSSDHHAGEIRSPVLKSLLFGERRISDSKITAENGREYSAEEIIYHDILKCAFGSNAKTIDLFLDKLEEGDSFIKKLHHSIKTLQAKEVFSKEELSAGIDYIETLNSIYYSQMRSGRKEEFQPTTLISLDDAMNESIGMLDYKVGKVVDRFTPTSRYSLGDRVVRSFCYPLGIGGIADARAYLQKQKENTTQKNMQAVCNGEIGVPTGNYIYKGILNAKNLSGILESGVLAREYAGTGSTGDATPLDTDFATAGNTNHGLRRALQSSVASAFSKEYARIGDLSGVFLAVKLDNRFQYELDDSLDETYCREKYGYFPNGDFFVDDFPDSTEIGVRTGIPSSAIDYIAADDDSLPEVIRQVKKCDFYIPVTDLDGNLSLTPEEWESSAH